MALGVVVGFAAVVGAALLVGACAARDDAPPKPPRFSRLVIVMIDTLRSDHLEAYGYSRDTAPFLAELAAEGIQVQGTSASSWTRPSVATVLTGLYPQRHQATTRADKLPDSVPFLPAFLTERGFDTSAFVANPVVGRSFGFARGYTRYRQFSGGKRTKPPASEVTDRALGLAGSGDGAQFLYVHYLDPHDPYIPRQAWGRSEETPDDFVQPRQVFEGSTEMTQEYLQRLRDQYDGAIQEMDLEIRRLLETLGERGLLDDCLVVVTADHGELFGEHAALTHGRGLWQEELQVPLIFWARDGLAPRRPSGVFHHVDLMPTLLEALGVDPPPELDGSSLWSALTVGRIPERRDYLYSLDLHEKATALGLVNGRHKLIHRTLQPSTLLFRLDNDPDESKNLTGKARLRDEMLFRATELHNRLSVRRFPRSVTGPDAETRRQLEALGYVDPAEAAEAADELLAEALESRHLPDVLMPRGSLPFAPFAGLQPGEMVGALDPRSHPLQLLRGWPPGWRQPDGARCRKRASLLLANHGATDLALMGTLPADAGEIRLTVRCDEGPERDFTLQPGPIRLRYPKCVPSPSRRPVRVELRHSATEDDGAPGVVWTRFALTGPAE